MFSFFSKKNKNINSSLPISYQSLVSQNDYDEILNKSIEEVKKFGAIKSVNDGTITIESPFENEDELNFHLDNLVRKCHNTDKSDWGELIADHFQRFNRDLSKETYISKDFDFAHDLLVVLVKPMGSIPENDVSDFIYREDIPQTYTFLALQYDGAFHYVRKDEISDWEKTEDELFEIGLSNIPKDEIEIENYLIEDEYEFYAFYSGDFSAAYILELELKADFAVGQYGSVVSIPAKGTAFVYPIYGKNALGFIKAIADLRQKIYNEDPAPISENFYWYYAQKFIQFPEEELDDVISISYPNPLYNLLNEDFPE